MGNYGTWARRLGVAWRWTSVSRCGQRKPRYAQSIVWCVLRKLCANKKKEEVKSDFGDLRIRERGAVVNTPLVFKRVLLRREGEKRRGNPKGERAEKKDKRESGRENGRKEEERRKRERERRRKETEKRERRRKESLGRERE
ncbi:hypothetical protein TNCV_3976971 [Trichonephila clavipes]|nr:hypothetical protein TNCV_3976971 [Trichonephila clavipes]